MFPYFNFHPLEVVSRYRDPQLQVDENYIDYLETSHLRMLTVVVLNDEKLKIAMCHRLMGSGVSSLDLEGQMIRQSKPCHARFVNIILQFQEMFKIKKRDPEISFTRNSFW